MTAKCAIAPGAQDYCFKTRSGLLLDPTDAAGRLSSHPAPGLPWLPTDFTLACINEPPRGAGGTNVSVRLAAGDLALVGRVSARAGACAVGMHASQPVGLQTRAILNSLPLFLPEHLRRWRTTPATPMASCAWRRGTSSRGRRCAADGWGCRSLDLTWLT